MLFIFVAVLLGPILLAVAWIAAPNAPSKEKLAPYECGFSPLEGQTRTPFRVRFYLVGILFLLFDLELLVTFPVVATRNAFFDPLRLSILLGFVALLTVGFIFEIRLKVVDMSNFPYVLGEGGKIPVGG
jgi:NADH:ubiquinone oxidoreductase subunit 3 (subunit A)